MTKRLCKEILLKCKSYPIFFILLDIDSNMILKEFGEYFFEFCKRSDSDHVLMTLAGNIYNFWKTWGITKQQRNDILRAFRLLQNVTGRVIVEQVPLLSLS